VIGKTSNSPCKSFEGNGLTIALKQRKGIHNY
jgi:hypothetical protein